MHSLGFFNSGFKDSLWRYWNVNGDLVKEEYYYGKDDKRLLFYRDRNGDTLVINGNGYFVDHFAKGDVKQEGNIKDGKEDLKAVNLKDQKVRGIVCSENRDAPAPGSGGDSLEASCVSTLNTVR